MATATTTTAAFVIERETKGAIRYQEVDKKSGKPVEFADALIGTVYLRKSALDGKTPQKITIEVREEK